MPGNYDRIVVAPREAALSSETFITFIAKAFSPHFIRPIFAHESLLQCLFAELKREHMIDVEYSLRNATFSSHVLSVTPKESKPPTVPKNRISMNM